MTSPPTLNAFKRRIADANKPFEILEPLEGPSARVHFTGIFCNEEVLWDAHIMTLETLHQQALQNGDPPAIDPRQFIDIGADEAAGRLIRIGLHVPIIDEPTIWKTVTMVRHYKRLRFGRIEWGQGSLFPG